MLNESNNFYLIASVYVNVAKEIVISYLKEAIVERCPVRLKRQTISKTHEDESAVSLSKLSLSETGKAYPIMPDNFTSFYRWSLMNHALVQCVI